MKLRLHTVGLIVGGAGLCVGLLPFAMAQQGTPSQTPRPGNPSPRPSQPGQQPGSPAQPGQPSQPGSPRDPNTPANPNDPRNPSNPTNPQKFPDRPAGSRNTRPFAFQNPSDEARFNEGSQRLVRMEQRFEQSNQELTKRLGEVRQMSADKQGAATMDLLQQILKSHTELQQYLVSSRTLWTGDVNDSGMDGQQPEAQPIRGREPMKPVTTPGR